MAWFSPFSRGEIVDLSSEEIRPDQTAATLLDRSRTSVDNALDNTCAEEQRLVDEIADRTERLRQVRVVKEALTAARKIMADGDAAGAEPAARPRLRVASTEDTAAETVHVTPRGKVVKSRATS
jgi:hypothetical protein